ncbi:hypothetical protein F3Y22_tig00111100pilonHSYRG00126 [Hibiscus syriacus]|uniref:Integrase catalytic domain-containing protein n=1 Tax=Hibiscus syriacus TaxID=106335 RepID=A0A6A2YZV3_HIBSY|nr:hypothetical protein F3Y22_tig00111100pilonHSYRG00126 [Hibiscus syriacus]
MDLTSSAARSFSNKKVNVVLDETNFLLWKQQVLLIVRSHWLERLLIGDVSSLPMTVLDPNGETRVNEEYEDFVAQDSALASWLLSTMGKHLLPQFVGAETTAASIRKGNDCMRVYLTRIKEVCDALASCESIVPPVEQIVAILKGIPREYQPFIVVVSTMKEDLSIDNIYSMLMDAEVQIVGGNCAPSSASGSRNGGRGRGRSRVQCQLCGKLGHLVDRCWHRFDEDFTCVNTNNYHSSKDNSFSSYPSSGSVSTSGNKDCECCSRLKSDSQSNMVAASSERLVVDSGATHHITPDKTNLTNASDFLGPGKVIVGNGVSLDIRTVGRSILPTKSRILLLHVPHIAKNLISVSKLARDNNIFFEFHANNCCVRDEVTNRVLLTGEESGGLYSFIASHTGKEDICTAADVSLVTKSTTSELEELWHRRLGHPSTKILRQETKELDVKFSLDSNKTCTACQMGKSHRLPFMHSITTYDTPFQLIFTDLWGPPHISSNGFRYYASFIDSCTRHKWIYLLKYKSQATKAFLLFQKMVLTQFGASIKSVQSDWGGEFRSLSPLLAKDGIIHRLSCPHTSEQNRVIERKHRHSVEMALVLLAHITLPMKFLSYAIISAAQLINKLPTKVLQGLSPSEKLFGKKPNYDELRVFRCQCFPHLRLFQAHKLTFRSQPCTYLGVSPQHKSFLCLDVDGKVYVSRHVVFNETMFPFTGQVPPIISHVAQNHHSQSLEIVPHRQPVPTQQPAHPGTPDNSTSGETLPFNMEDVSMEEATGESSNALTDASGETIPENNPVEEVVGESSHLVTPNSNTSEINANTEGNFEIPASNLNLEIPHAADRFHMNDHPMITRGKRGRAAVGYKWLFKVKCNPYGSVHRYKARLVAKVSNDWELRHVDINNAFLNGDLREAAFMQQPPGFVQSAVDGLPLVCQLRKALYGLKQTPHNWHTKLKDLLEKASMENSSPCATPMTLAPKLAEDVTLEYGLMFLPSKARYVVSVFVDADWGANVSDRRSISGFGVFLDNHLVAWSSKKQKIVSRSTMEAEYKSLADTTAEVTWVRVVAMSANPVYHAQSKHVDLEVHFIHEKVAAQQLCVNYIPAAHQIADGFTNPLSKASFEMFREKIGVQVFSRLGEKKK